MLQGFKIQNFQSCKNIEIKNLANITIIMGLNNTGKSSILKGVNFPVEAFINGTSQEWGEETEISPYFHSYEETVFEKDVNKKISISYEITPNNELKILLNLLKKDENYKNISFNKITIKVEYDKDDLINDSLFDENNSVIYEKQEDKIYLSENKLEKELDSKAQDWIIQSDDELSSNIDDIHNEIRNFFKKIHFFSVDRRARNWIARPKRWNRIGIHGENVVSLLNYIKNTDEECYEKFCNLVYKISPDIIKLRTPMTEQGEVSLSHRSSGLKIDINTLMSGTGLNQAIPIMVQLMYSKEGDIILIEEPELSLYPSAQEVIADLIITESKNDKKIICTTHSDSIPFRFWVALKKKEISTKFINTFITHKENGETKIIKKSLEQSLNIIFAPKDYTPS